MLRLETLRELDVAQAATVDGARTMIEWVAGRFDLEGSVASEWLSGDIGGHDLTAEIFIDSHPATITNGEAGASIVSGPRLGPNTRGDPLFGYDPDQPAR